MTYQWKLAAIIDTETGGFSEKTDAVIQIGALMVDTDLNIVRDKAGNPAVFNSYIYPPQHLLCRIGALKATGIDMMKVLTAPEEQVVARVFRQWLEQFAPVSAFSRVTKRRFVKSKQSPIFAGYNAGYDYKMLKAVQDRTGEEFPYYQPEIPEEGLEEPPFIDVLKIARSHLSKKVIPNHHLRTVAAHFHSPYMNSHDALEDCYATLDSWRGLTQMGAA